METREEGRSREGAWIEIARSAAQNEGSSVAPARERGLKLRTKRLSMFGTWSLPRGSVD